MCPQSVVIAVELRNVFHAFCLYASGLLRVSHSVPFTNCEWCYKVVLPLDKALGLIFKVRARQVVAFGPVPTAAQALSENRAEPLILETAAEPYIDNFANVIVPVTKLRKALIAATFLSAL